MKTIFKKITDIFKIFDFKLGKFSNNNLFILIFVLLIYIDGTFDNNPGR
jgi:hypothetical protein